MDQERERANLVGGVRKVLSEELDGLERSGGGRVDLGDDKVESGESDVGAVDEAVALHGVLRREVRDVAAVYSRLECSEVEAVPQVEQVIRGCHLLLLLPLLLCRSHPDR